jgi:hypothetical protein
VLAGFGFGKVAPPHLGGFSLDWYRMVLAAYARLGMLRKQECTLAGPRATLPSRTCCWWCGLFRLQ